MVHLKKGGNYMKEKLATFVLLVVLAIGVFVYAISNRYQMQIVHPEREVYILDVWKGDLYFCTSVYQAGKPTYCQINKI